MQLKDSRGLAASTTRSDSLERFERAAELFHGYYGDPLGAIDAALAEDPGFALGHALKAGLLVSAGDGMVRPLLAQTVAVGEALAHANDRERRHIGAARAWLDGDFHRASRIYGDLLLDHPRDLLALQLAHLMDFYLGQSAMLRDRVARVLPDWDESIRGFGYVLGMHAFGLEETGDYARAEVAGRRALHLNRRDPWAVHAVAHVMEMQGRLGEGVAWLESRADDWSHDNGFAFHNWWHLALYYLDLGRHERVLALYDRQIHPKATGVALEMIDASAMLWRLTLRGVDTGARWNVVADEWAPKAEDGFYAFNDVHAMMAFVGARRFAEADALLARMVTSAERADTNGMMTREVGLPVARALLAFGRGRYAETVDLLRPVRLIAHRFGGSHAQRDVLSLTLVEAALRAGHHKLAKALAAERMQLKPSSPFNWKLSLRAQADEAAALAA
jgi:tetratricopeptide (TPR) repeat protein